MAHYPQPILRHKALYKNDFKKKRKKEDIIHTEDKEKKKNRKQQQDNPPPKKTTKEKKKRKKQQQHETIQLNPLKNNNRKDELTEKMNFCVKAK